MRHKISRFRGLRSLGPPCLVLYLVAACSAGETVEIQLTRVEPGGGDPVRPGATHADRFGAPDGHPPTSGMSTTSGGLGAATSSEVPLEWDVPEGWGELGASGMRLANLRPGGDPEAECSLVVLGGDGGGLAANVNRWRAQMGHAPLDSAGVEALPQARLLGLPATRVELVGAYSGMGDPSGARPDWGMRGVVAPTEQFTIFVKMTGPAEVVAAEAAAFDAFCESIRPRREALDAPVTAESDAAAEDFQASGGPMSFTLPPGWRDAGARSMRVVNLIAGETTQCYVILLAGEAGGLAANLNRWRSEVGLEPLDDAGIAQLEEIELLGGTSPLLEVSGDYQGMGEGGGAGQTVLGALVIRPTQSVFVKMVGPSAEVAMHREAFVAFCASLEERE